MQDADAAAEIERLEAAWGAAFLSRDIETLQGLLAPEFRLVGVRSTGAQDMPREAWFSNLEAMTFHAFEAQVLSVEVHGDTAIAAVDGSWKMDWGPRKIDERFYLTDIWIRRDGRWQVVRRHSSPYQPAVT